MKIIWALALLLVARSVPAQQLQIGSGTSWRSNSSTLVVLENMGIQYDAASATLANTFIFTGNADVRITGSNLPLFSTIQLGKTGTAKIILQRNINLTQSLSFQGGLFDLNGYALNLGSNALLINESETSRLTGNSGYARIITDLNAPGAVNPGNLGAVITSLQNLGSTYIYRGVQSQTGSGGNGSSVLRYFDIQPANNTGLNATLRFLYFDAELNGLNENNLVQFKSTDNITWTSQGYSSRDAALNFVEQTGIQDFSRWTLSTPGNPLPVQFILFTSRCQGNSTVLTWKTGAEHNSVQFLVQESPDGNSFTTAGVIPAAGNSTAEQTYQFTVINTPGNIVFYRLAEQDADGNLHYTAINRRECDKSTKALTIWPNPAHGLVNLSIFSPATAPAELTAMNSQGQVVFRQHITLLTGNNGVQLNTGKWAAGMYRIIILSPSGQILDVKQFFHY